MDDKIHKTDEEWRRQLSDEQYRVTRRKGTERAFSGEYWDCHQDGVYACVCCGQPLFDSGTKFESGTGWPSFWRPVAEDNVARKVDKSWFSVRTEVLCSRCDAENSYRLVTRITARLQNNRHRDRASRRLAPHAA